MKKTLLIMVMALAVLLTQCRKPEVKFPSPVAPEGTTVSMTVTAGPGSKTDITPAGVIKWSSGDRLYVGYNGAYVGYLTLTSGQNTPTGTFSGDVTLTDISEGTTQTFGFYYLGSAERTLTVGATTVDVDFSSQNIYNNGGKLENASAQHVGYGTASGTVKDGIVTGINVTLVSKVALARFSFTESDSKGAYDGALILSGDNIYNKMKVNFSASGFDFTAVKDSNISLTGGHGERYVMLVPAGTSAAILNFGGGASGTKTLENGIEANKFYRMPDGSAIEVEVTPFEFSVGENTTVEFSPGNLYYDGSSWQFEDNQWDFRTYEGKASCINGVYNASSGTPTGHWGLFGWSGSTASATYGMSTSTDWDAYSGNFKDWGDLAIGGYKVNTWHTLTCDEWTYLLGCKAGGGPDKTDDGRPNAKNLCEWKELDSNTHKGLVILPDGTENPSGVLGSITKTSDLAAHGAVFLPAAGFRGGADVSSLGSYGNYWASTTHTTEMADCLIFWSGEFYAESNYRTRGCCVRLVR